MKILNNQHKGTTWTCGLFPSAIVFDQLTIEHIPFLERIGMNHLVIDVCSECKKPKCRCKKAKRKDEAEQK